MSATKSQEKGVTQDNAQPSAANYRGIYFNEQPARYIDPDTGAHFDYTEMCIKLEHLRIQHEAGLHPEQLATTFPTADLRAELAGPEGKARESPSSVAKKTKRTKAVRPQRESSLELPRLSQRQLGSQRCAARLRNVLRRVDRRVAMREGSVPEDLFLFHSKAMAQQNVAVEAEGKTSPRVARSIRAARYHYVSVAREGPQFRSNIRNLVDQYNPLR